MRRRSRSRVGLGAAALVAGVLLAHSAAAVVEWNVQVVEGFEPGAAGYTVDIYVNSSLIFTDTNSMTPGSPGLTVDYMVPWVPGDLIEADLVSLGSADYDLYLYDEWGFNIDFSNWGPGTLDTVAGICDDVYEIDINGNDTYLTAYNFSPSPGVWLSTIGDVGVQLNYDFYTIVVPAGETYVTVDCQFTDAFGDIEIQLHDTSGIYVPFSRSASSSDNELINGIDVVTPGAYYIRVETYFLSTLGNTYDLMWTTSSIPPPDPVLTISGCSPGTGGSSLAWLLPLILAAFVLRRKVALA